MSAGQTFGVTGDQLVDSFVNQYKQETIPVLEEIDDSGNLVRTFDPGVVTRLGGTLPWDTNSTQLQCEQTVTETNGDMNTRLVYECIATHTQFKTLQRMRESPSRVELVSQGYTGPVNFDELRWERIADANGAESATEGEINEPLYEIQLQSKETDE